MTAESSERPPAGAAEAERQRASEQVRARCGELAAERGVIEEVLGSVCADARALEADWAAAREGQEAEQARLEQSRRRLEELQAELAALVDELAAKQHEIESVRHHFERISRAECVLERQLELHRSGVSRANGQVARALESVARMQLKLELAASAVFVRDGDEEGN